MDEKRTNSKWQCYIIPELATGQGQQGAADSGFDRDARPFTREEGVVGADRQDSRQTSGHAG